MVNPVIPQSEEFLQHISYSYTQYRFSCQPENRHGYPDFNYQMEKRGNDKGGKLRRRKK